ncbi:phosphoglycerate mutase family protein [Aspergillus arachidicola]|uniref:Phosphoglycerate mutase family protein n=1 Tax=Aspergillus arachidicola TaxID=656916 RepID=A0A2G7FUM6_9EURO|nr:phosphoglycerate mutase family protein [Aspergillus arachidicola]
MGHSSQGDEFFDFDNFFDIPSDYVDSNPTSVNSISPKDFDLTYNDLDGSNWDSGLDMCTQFPFTDFVNHEPSFQEYFGDADAEPVVDPNDILQLPSTSPSEVFVGSELDSTWLPGAHGYDDHYYSTIRHMVESQAAVDPSCSSKKEKRREAAIALHLQRLQDAPLPETDMSSDSNTSFPSPPWSVSHDPACASPATTSLSDSTKSPTPPSADATPGGIELVLDLNMNTPANLPRKQKPRSRAQKENYIKVRKHGACEKHRKQHKRCNCLDIKGVRLNVNNPALSTTAVLDATRQTSLPLHSPSHVQPRHVSLTKQTQPGVLPPTVESPKTVVWKHRERDVRRSPQDNYSVTAPSPLDVYRGRHSPGSLSKPMNAANTGQLRAQVLQPYRSTTPWRGVDQTPSVPGRLMSPTQSLLVTTSKQQSVLERGICHSAVNRVSSGSPQTITWRVRQVPKGNNEGSLRIQSTSAEMNSLPLQSVSTNRSSSGGSQQLRIAQTISTVTSQQVPRAALGTNNTAMAMTSKSPSDFHFNFTTVTGYFLQDDPKTDPDNFDYVSSNFGLIPRSYDSDTEFDPEGRKTQWERFKYHIDKLNRDSGPETQFKLLFLGRHGEGVHNVAESKYGTELWDCYWSLQNGDETGTWVDARLTPLGISQAETANQAWRTQIQNNIPSPQSYYVSPLNRCLATASITFKDLGLPHTEPFRPLIKELLRETLGLHTCDSRSSKTAIAEEYPLYRFEEGFAEEDPLYDPELRESDSARDVRLRELLSDVFAHDESTVVSLTAHSGAITSILEGGEG